MDEHTSMPFATLTSSILSVIQRLADVITAAHVLSGDGHDDDVGAIEGSFQRAGHVHRARQLESRKKVVVLTVIADGRDHLGLACPQCRGATG